jgi:hypothetical protein
MRESARARGTRASERARERGREGEREIERKREREREREPETKLVGVSGMGIGFQRSWLGLHFKCEKDEITPPERESTHARARERERETVKRLFSGVGFERRK